ncbi:MAG: hypothetical protein WAV47_00260, partial [Blastocatellia bacterium]
KYHMDKLRAVIDSYLDKMGSLDHLDALSEDDLKRFSEAVRLYQRLSGARETAVELKTVGSLIPSLAFPILSFFGKSLIQLWNP